MVCTHISEHDTQLEKVHPGVATFQAASDRLCLRLRL